MEPLNSYTEKYLLSVLTFALVVSCLAIAEHLNAIY